jgi:nicotinamidase-related amidase
MDLGSISDSNRNLNPSTLIVIGIIVDFCVKHTKSRCRNSKN